MVPEFFYKAIILISLEKFKGAIVALQKACAYDPSIMLFQCTLKWARVADSEHADRLLCSGRPACLGVSACESQPAVMSTAKEIMESLVGDMRGASITGQSPRGSPARHKGTLSPLRLDPTSRSTSAGLAGLATSSLMGEAIPSRVRCTVLKPSLARRIIPSLIASFADLCDNYSGDCITTILVDTDESELQASIADAIVAQGGSLKGAVEVEFTEAWLSQELGGAARAPHRRLT